MVVDQSGSDTELGGQLYLGATKYLVSPVMGLGLGLEAYGEKVAGLDFDGGGRAYSSIRAFNLHLGVDYKVRPDHFAFVLSVIAPLRRGGIFGRGSEFRFDWLPARDHTIQTGFRFYFGPRTRGRMRPRHTDVRLPAAPSSAEWSAEIAPTEEMTTYLDRLAHSAEWMSRYTTPYVDQNASGDEEKEGSYAHELAALHEHVTTVDVLFPEGHDPAAEARVYHASLDGAFGLALAGGSANEIRPDEAQAVADRARQEMFEGVIVPYNRLLGRTKKDDSLLGYGGQSSERFRLWLESRPGLTLTQSEHALCVFDRWLGILESCRERSRKLWGYSEFVWLPLQYGLTPDRYATRDGLDGIIEEMAGKQFSPGNEVTYVIAERLQLEHRRMILAAEDYHILWVHDFRGKNAAGKPDRVSFDTVLTYLEALTRAVERYDERGHLTLYMIAADQYFYSLMKGERYMALLQDPLHHKLDLPKEFASWLDELEAARVGLRAAIDGSERLQEQVAEYGEDWLRKTVKVHVNITNPADYAFRSNRMVKGLPFLPDELMRDHRKLAFYDVSEEDPGRGEGVYSGAGVGHQYSGQTWDDRSLLVRGPALLSLRDEFVELLREQNFKDEEIPAELLPREKPADYDEKVAALVDDGWISSAMNLHNRTGFNQKDGAVLKATLYNLMPPRSTIMVPDGLWNAPLWGSMLSGAALRGGKVMVIGIAAHTPAFYLNSRSHDLFNRLIDFEKKLHDEIAARGGMLKVGIYNRQAAIGDIVSAYEEMKENVKTGPFLEDIFPFTNETLEEFDALVTEAKESGLDPVYLAEDPKVRYPKMHLKVNLFLSEETLGLIQKRQWVDILRAYWHYHEKFVLKEGVYTDAKELPRGMVEPFSDAVGEFWGSLSPEERETAMIYMTLGSHNMDYRSMMLDGESICLVEGFGGLSALFDMYSIAALSVWIDDEETLSEYIPKVGGLGRWIGRVMKKQL